MANSSSRPVARKKRRTVFRSSSSSRAIWAIGYPGGAQLLDRGVPLLVADHQAPLVRQRGGALGHDRRLVGFGDGFLEAGVVADDRPLDGSTPAAATRGVRQPTPVELLADRKAETCRTHRLIGLGSFKQLRFAHRRDGEE